MLFQTLDEHWSIRPLEEFQQGIYPPDDGGWLPATVPGHWQQIPALVSHTGKVVYRCRFSASPPSPGERAWLRVNGAFYYSRIYLNGVDLGPHTGYFIPRENEVGALLRETNELLIELDCPDERDKHNKRMITGIFSHWDCFDPAANPGGIWLPVELHRSGATRLSHATLRTETADQRFAQIRFSLDLDASDARTVNVRLRFAPRTFAGAVQEFTQQRSLLPGTQEIGGLIKLRDPQLWWTHDLGQPDLYDVTVDIVEDDQVSDSRTLTFGVRTFELRNWIAYLNGVRFLVKGNNYPPGDMRIASVTRALIDGDLQLAKNCFMNMLRVHAHVDHPQLYEAADAAGILLWQDFPLQWLYDQSVLEDAMRQVRWMVRLLGSHPAVAIWCMHNEAILIEDTADERIITRLRTFSTVFGFSWNRDVMDTQLKRIAETEDPGRPVVRSSGEFDIPFMRQGTDGHAYFGWYRNYGTLADAEVMSRRFPGNLAFMTEFGSQSFPNLESSLKFMPAILGDDDVRHLAAHHGFQDEIMANWIAWREAGSLAEMIEMSQDYQIFINRYYIDRLRVAKYRPTGGIIPFIFIDPFPAILWSVVDYWRVPKRSYYAMRTAFSPQYACCIFSPRVYSVGEPIELPIFAVNDAQQPVSGALLYAELCDPDGHPLAESRRRIDLAADGSAEIVDRLRLTPTRPGRYALELTLSGVAHEVRQMYEIAVADSRPRK